MGQEVQGAAWKRAQHFKLKPHFGFAFLSIFEPEAAGLPRAGHQALLLMADMGERLRHRPGRRDGTLDRERGKAEE